jgi:hypothetical protein
MAADAEVATPVDDCTGLGARIQHRRVTRNSPAAFCAASRADSARCAARLSKARCFKEPKKEKEDEAAGLPGAAAAAA